MKRKFLFFSVCALVFFSTCYHWRPLIMFRVGCFFSPEKVQVGYKIQSVGKGHVSLENFSLSTQEVCLEADRCDIALSWDWHACQFVTRIYFQKPHLKVKELPQGNATSWKNFFFPKWVRWYIGSSPGVLSIGDSSFALQVDAENQHCSLGVGKEGVLKPVFLCTWQSHKEHSLHWDAKVFGTQVEEMEAIYALFRSLWPELPLLTHGKVRLSAKGGVDSQQGFACHFFQLDLNDLQLRLGEASLCLGTCQSEFSSENGFSLMVGEGQLSLYDKVIAANVRGQRERGVWTVYGEHVGLGPFHLSLAEEFSLGLGSAQGELIFDSMQKECRIELATPERGEYAVSWAFSAWDLTNVYGAFAPFLESSHMMAFSAGLIQGEGSLLFDLTHLKRASMSNLKGENVQGQFQNQGFSAQSMIGQWGWQEGIHQWELYSCMMDVGVIQEPVQVMGAVSWKEGGYYLTGSLSLQEECMQFGGVVSSPWFFSINNIQEGWFRGEGISERLYSSLLKTVPFTTSGECNVLGTLEWGVIDCTIIPKSLALQGQVGRINLGESHTKTQPIHCQLSSIDEKWSVNLPFVQERLELFALPGTFQDAEGTVSFLGRGTQVDIKIEMMKGTFLYQGIPVLEEVSFYYEGGCNSQSSEISHARGKFVHPGLQPYVLDVFSCKQEAKEWQFQGGISCDSSSLLYVEGRTQQEGRVVFANFASIEGQRLGDILIHGESTLSSQDALNSSGYKCSIPSLKLYSLDIGECSITLTPGDSCWIMEGQLGKGQVSCGIKPGKDLFHVENFLFTWEGSRFLGDSSFFCDFSGGAPNLRGKVLGKWQWDGDGEICMLRPIDFFWEPLNGIGGISDLFCFSQESTFTIGELCYQKGAWKLVDGEYSVSSTFLGDALKDFVFGSNDFWINCNMLPEVVRGKCSGIISPQVVQCAIETDFGENIQCISDKQQGSWTFHSDKWCIQGQASQDSFFLKKLKHIEGTVFGCTCDLHVCSQTRGLQGTVLVDFDAVPVWLSLPAGIPTGFLGKGHSFSGQFLEGGKLFEGLWSGLDTRLGIVELACTKANISITPEAIVLHDVEIRDPAIQGKISLARVDSGLLTVPEARLTQCLLSQLSLSSKGFIQCLPFKLKKWVIEDLSAPLADFAQCQAKGRMRFETLWEQIEEKPFLCSLEKRGYAHYFPVAGELDYEIFGGAFVLKQLRNCFGKKVQQSFFLGESAAFFGFDGVVSLEVGCQQRGGGQFYINWQGHVDSPLVEILIEE